MDQAAVVDASRIAQELNLRREQVEQVTALLDEGNTVPFITRYRKERTGNLDEDQIRRVQQKVQSARQLKERATAILRLIDAQGKLSPELRQAIEQADTLKRLEDLYLPYRPKRRTKAAIAKERGLEPLADAVWNATPEAQDLKTASAHYVDAEKELPSTVEVLEGVKDILAERIGEDADLRSRCRRIAANSGKLTVSATKHAEDKGQDFRDYFDYTEMLQKVPPHRLLAINRGEKLNVLRVKFQWDSPRAEIETTIFLRLTSHPHQEFLKECVDDALARFIAPGLERELRKEATERSERHAVQVFAENLRNLLLQPPLKGERILAIDPGFRTGCKIAVLDETGTKIATDVIYITGKEDKVSGAQEKLASLLTEHHVRLLAIGNGTACRETEELVSKLISEQHPEARYLIVNEAGASIYSTSAIGREEFPDEDATVRGTISIGRRLQDPLSELVKIEPQHIGVGMYQHDVDPKELKTSLDQVVESCVNYVGVNLNTASAALLRHVAGLNQLVARRIVEYREQHGAFRNRQQLQEVPGVGDATFTQAAGFLRIPNAEEPLDGTSIHPESYTVARTVMEKLDITSDSLTPGHEASHQLQTTLKDLQPSELAEELNVGLPTLQDILADLARPGRDPRSDLPAPVFKQGILKLEDLNDGMELQGTVLNVVDFGAFVDIGVKNSGLVHISQMSKNFVKSPHRLVSVGDVLTVWVISVDHERQRVALTMIKPDNAIPGPANHEPVENTSDEEVEVGE